MARLRKAAEMSTAGGSPTEDERDSTRGIGSERAGAGRYGRAAAARRHLRPHRRRAAIAPSWRGRQNSKSTADEGCALSAQPWPTPCRSPLLLLLLLHG